MTLGPDCMALRAHTSSNVDEAPICGSIQHKREGRAGVSGAAADDALAFPGGAGEKRLDKALAKFGGLPQPRA